MAIDLLNDRQRELRWKPDMEKLNRTLVRDILNYFLEHPDAIDTLEGIATWRLTQEALKRRVHETREALHWLTEEGYLGTVETGGEDLFRLNPDLRKEAERFLDSQV